MALPRYTAQLRDQLKLKKSQALFAATLITLGPPVAISLIVQDPSFYDKVIKPCAKFFGYYVILVWVVTLLNVAILQFRINNLTDSSEN
jgi:hypothetical protein